LTLSNQLNEANDILNGPKTEQTDGQTNREKK